MGLLALRRYLPYLRPYVRLVIVFGIAQLGSLAASAAIPKVIQAIIDGPITDGNLAGLWPLGILLAVLGIGVAGLFYDRSILIARPVMRVE